jgi:hypothetical protein
MMRNAVLKFLLFGLIAAAVIGGVFFVFRDKDEPLPPAAPIVNLPPEVVYPVRAVVGHSVEGRPIESYTYGTGTDRLVFVGGVHGGYEWNSVLLAYAFIDHLDLHYKEELPDGLAVTIIPSLNPDGVYAVTGVAGRFTVGDILDGVDESVGRFNANKVDLNRNFACKWQPKSTWRSTVVSAGTSAFSEPESRALRDVVSLAHPNAVIFWHSKSNAVYASECEKGILPGTRAVMNVYAKAAGYPPVDSFDAYAITGDAEGWLASIGVPAITVELKTHEDIEWGKNLAGFRALVSHIRPGVGL